MHLRTISTGLAALALATTFTLAAPEAMADDRADALKWVPADTAMVVSVDVKGLQSTDFYAEMMGYARQDDEFAGIIREMRETAGFDLEKDLQSVVLAVPGNVDSSSNFLVVANGTFDEKKIVKAFEKESSETLTSAKHEGRTYWGFESKGALLFDGGTMLFGTKTTVKAAIEAKKAGKALAKPMPSLLKGVDQDANIWWAAVFPDDIRSSLGSQVPQGSEMQSLRGSLDFSTGMTLAAAVGLSNEGAAEGLHKMAETVLDEAKADPTAAALGMDAVLAKIALGTAGSEVSLALKLDEKAFGEAKAAFLEMWFGVSASQRMGTHTTPVQKKSAP